MKYIHSEAGACTEQYKNKIHLSFVL